jgi:hypothetical protein
MLASLLNQLLDPQLCNKKPTRKPPYEQHNEQYQRDGWKHIWGNYYPRNWPKTQPTSRLHHHCYRRLFNVDVLLKYKLLRQLYSHLHALIQLTLQHSYPRCKVWHIAKLVRTVFLHDVDVPTLVQHRRVFDSKLLRENVHFRGPLNS